jgi:hypothetical protein
LVVSRRFFIGAAISGLAAGQAASPAAAQASVRTTGPVDPMLLKRAREALERHQSRIALRDFMAVADFSLPSREPRFHVISLAEGSVRSYLVAHGRGSDPSRTGWLQRFSNEPRSNATSSGAYLTDSFYTGAHGHSLRLRGLDATNSNAYMRAIVVHAAWYVNRAAVGYAGVLGRSEGCFAVADSSLPEILGRLGPGRLIYADKPALTV